MKSTVQVQAEHRRHLLNHRSLLPFVGITLFSLFVFGRYAQLDPDFHHDGLQFAVAIAVSDGYAVHGEVFSQYGPVPSWIQGILLSIFGPHLLVLRIQTVAVLSLSAVLLYALMAALKVPRLAALLVSSVWVLSCPAWSAYQGLFPLWILPSAILTTLVLLAALLMVLAISSASPRTSSSLLVAAGVVLGVGLFVRINYVVPIWVLAFTFLAFAQSRDLQVGRHSLKYFSAGTFVGTFGPLSVLVGTGSLYEHIDQTIISPLTFYSSASLNLQSVVALYGLGVLPYGLAVATGCASCFVRSRLTRILLLAITFAISAVLASLALGSRVRQWILSVTGEPAASSLVVQWMDLQGIVPLYAGATLSVVAFVFALVRLRAWRPELSPRLLVIWLSMGSLAQLFPLFDPYHLWWAIPLSLAVFASVVTSICSGWRTSVVLSAVLIPFVALNVLLWNNIAIRERVPAPGPALRGMLVPTNALPGLKQLDSLLQESPEGKTRFLCGDGLLSVWSGEYAASSGAFVSWAFGGQNPDDNGFVRSVYSGSPELPPASVLQFGDSNYILCVTDVADADVSQWAQVNELRIVGTAGPVQPRQDRPTQVYRLEPIRE